MHNKFKKLMGYRRLTWLHVLLICVINDVVSTLSYYYPVGNYFLRHGACGATLALLWLGALKFGDYIAGLTRGGDVRSRVVGFQIAHGTQAVRKAGS